MGRVILICCFLVGLFSVACQEKDTVQGGAEADAHSPPDSVATPDADRAVDVFTDTDTGTDTGTEVESDAAHSEPRGTVAVWMGLGEREGDEGCYFVGEMQSDGTGCEIVRVHWDIDKEHLIDEVTVVADPGPGVGAWQPNVSGDGATLAFAQHSGGGLEIRTLGIVDGTPGAGAPVGGLETGVWSWPNLGADGRLTVSRGDKEPQCRQMNRNCSNDDCCKDVAHWSKAYQLDGDFSAAPAVISDSGFSFQDTYAHPTRPEFVAGHGKFDGVHPERYPVCTDQSDTPCSDVSMSPMPIVVNTETQQVWILQLESTEAPYGTAATPMQLEGCAHLAWTEDGKHLICTEQGSHEVLPSDKTSRLYHFAFDPDSPPLSEGVVATTAEPLFAHAAPSELFNIPEGKTCDVYHHKYAEFCGDSDLVVATIGCADCDAPDAHSPCALLDGTPTLLGDRVYLIDLKDPEAPRYFDLTGAVETSRGVPGNSLTSFTATCAAQ
ncbi:MAG: hypothetical protein VX938_02850 [Myxococcota bacterium]|nr:hypothetical protein [Myxococcota bacterium]